MSQIGFSFFGGMNAILKALILPVEVCCRLAAGGFLDDTAGSVYSSSTLLYVEFCDGDRIESFFDRADGLNISLNSRSSSLNRSGVFVTKASCESSHDELHIRIA